MKARKHLLAHVFVSLAALPIAVPPAFAQSLPGLQAPLNAAANRTNMPVDMQAATSRQGAAQRGADILVAQAQEPPKPEDENDPERKKKHADDKKPAEAPAKQPAPAEPKPEAQQPEPPKPEPPKPEPPKPEPPKPEPPKVEPPKVEAPKVEAPKPEAPKPAAPKPEAPKAAAPEEPPKPEKHKPEAPATQEPKAEAPKPEAPKPEPPKPEAPKPEAPKADAPKPDAKPAPKAETIAPDAKPAAEPAPAAPKPAKPQAEQGGQPAPAAEPAPKTLAAPAPAPAVGDAKQAPALDSAKQAPALDSAKPAPGAAPAPEAPAAAPGGTPRDAKRLQAPADGQQRAAPPPPKSDADAQAPLGKAPPPPKLAPTAADQGQRMQGRPRYDAPRDAQVEGRVDGRDILNILGQMIVRGGDSDRFGRDGAQTYYDQLPGGRTREVVERPNGVQIVSIRNRYGDVIQRSRIGRDGREVVLFYAPELENRPDREQVFRDPSLDLPPMQLDIPVDQYIIDTSNARNPDYYDFFREPPVERVERVYSLDEVRYSARIRDKMRRVDLDTIHFQTGSADVSMNEATSLKKIAAAMKRIIDRNPGETFLIEGHTDAVGSDQSNLVLSDRRAESVAVTLTDLFGIPPENLVTQGYGERFLKVRTDGPSAENRRVTIRRITPLVRPVATR